MNDGLGNSVSTRFNRLRLKRLLLKSKVHPTKWANAELMKIPNFLHLTPPVVKKQCGLLKRFCTPFPEGDVEKGEGN